MSFAEFEDRAAHEWSRIPDEFKAGVDAFVVSRDARAHARADGVYTLGECVTESYPSDFGGPDTIRSELRLYYGSFRRLAADDAGFDWDGEIWETLTHELKHHLESLASRDDLEDLDAAMEENFKRLDGERFEPLFYRSGVIEAEGRFRLDDTVFVETTGPRDRPFTFEFQGDHFAIEIPESEADVLFLTVEGLDEYPDEVIVVSLRPRSAAVRLLAILRRKPGSVAEMNATVFRP